MKTFLKITISSFLILVLFLTSVSAQTDQYNWYIKKNGRDAPDFPPIAQYVDERSGFYIDKDASAKGNKVIYLTFDAGYDNGNVMKTLDILKEYNVQGAFFILSNIIIKNTDTVKKMFADGHLVCNHTKNHKKMSTLTDEEMIMNLRTLEDICFNMTGSKMKKYFRFPEGNFDKRTLDIAYENGYKTFFWSLSYADWDNSKQMDRSHAINKILSNTHPGAVILLHPTSDINVEILPELIKSWRNEGYTFGTLDDLVIKNQ